MTFQELLKSREDRFGEQFNIAIEQNDHFNQWENDLNSFNRESMIAVVEWLSGEVGVPVPTGALAKFVAEDKWEKEFDKMFALDSSHSSYEFMVKCFISHLLYQERNSIIEMCNEMKIGYEDGFFDSDGRYVVYEKGEHFGYNKALKDIITKLEQAKKEIR